MPPSNMASHHQFDSADNGALDTAGNNSSTNDDVFQMQIELTALRNKLKLLNSGTDFSELLDLLKERDAELQTKDEQLRILNTKFHQITNGLAQIESERQLLRETNTKLESDHKKTSRHLNIREKEVMALVQRCAEQEEKLQESVGLRTSVNNLTSENAKLADTLATVEEDLKRMEAIRTKLNESESERQNCVNKLHRLERQFKEASEALDDRIAQLQSTIQSHTQEEERLREELTREKKERGIDRASNQKSVSELREKLTASRSELDKCNLRIKEYDTTISTLKKEQSTLKETYENRIKLMDDECTLMISKLKIEHEKNLDEMDKGRGELEKSLNKDLEEKEICIRSLKGQLSSSTSRCQDLESKLEQERTHNVQVLDDHKQKSEVLQEEKASLSERLQQLESDYAAIQEKSSLLEKTLLDRELKIETLENNVATSSKIHEEHSANQNETIERLQIETSRYEKENASLEKTVESLQRRIQLAEEQNRTFRDEKVVLSKNVEDLSKQTEELKQIEVLFTEEKRKTESLKSDLSRITSEVELLTSELLDERKKSERFSNESSAEIDRLDKQLQQANASFMEQNQKMVEIKKKDNATIKSLSAELEKWEEMSSSLQSQFEELQKQSKEEQELSKKKEEALESKLQRIKSDVDQKARRIDELNGKLKESNDNVFSLKDQISLVKENLNNIEMDSAAVVNDLEGQIKGLNQENEFLKSHLKEQEVEHQQELDKVKVDLEDTRNAKELKEKEAQELSLALQKQDDETNSMAKKMKAKEDTIGSLRAEITMLINAQTKTKLEYNNKIAALKLDIDEERSRWMADEEEYKREIEHLHQENSDMDGNLNYQGEQMSKQQELLNHRTELLANMVTQNKDLDLEVQENRALVAELQDECNEYLREKEDAEVLVVRLEKEAKSKEVDYLMAIHHERQLREGLEHELHEAQMDIETAKEEIRNLAELKRENKSLKDKVSRQEAFLKRKIEKEKVLKDRAMKGSERNSTVVQQKINPTTAPRTTTKITSSRGNTLGDTARKGPETRHNHRETTSRTNALMSRRSQSSSPFRDTRALPSDKKVLTERLGSVSSSRNLNSDSSRKNMQKSESSRSLRTGGSSTENHRDLSLDELDELLQDEI
mmetsp:Transcript_38734/g.56558  ORF Transcript_38734/g.56558 Transcript_38734/m.56558 type:complete len:1127 (-) Transcript_38734:202-3582(-)